MSDKLFIVVFSAAGRSRLEMKTTTTFAELKQEVLLYLTLSFVAA